MWLVVGVMAMVVHVGFLWSLSLLDHVSAYYGIFSVLGVADVVSIDVPADTR
jgi:hypothetical protein